ncbi:MAG: glycosyltransferase [Candidatus Sumerlaeia bacterium]|nr:glycosyltransferase [Candidatus Sumerlaeia bacterium]
MRILLLLDTFEDHLSGKMLHLLCQRWAPIRELRLSVLSLGPDGPLRERFRALGVRTAMVDASGPVAIRREGKKELFSKLRPDLLHSHCSWPAMGARLYHSGNQWVPYIESVHDLQPPPRDMMNKVVQFGLERHTRKYISAVTASCRHVRTHLKNAGIEPGKIKLIPMGVDGVQCFPLSPQSLSRYRKLFGVHDDEPLVVTAGQIEKGHLSLLDAWPAVREKVPDARLFFIGDGPAREELEARLREYNHDNSLRKIGPLDEIGPKVYGAADVVVHPGGENILPHEIAQAGAARAAVVAWDHGANVEYIRHDVTGKLVRPGNIESLAGTIVELLNNREKREELGNEAREYILEELEVSQTARLYIDLWRDLAPDSLWDQTNNLTAGEVDPFPLEFNQLKDPQLHRDG